MNNKISIIIAVFNNFQLLDKAIESVLKQTCSCYELIVIDGGSTDGTIDILNKYNNDIVYWISEKDNGIYDAWNKGISVASGNWIMFIGSDDILLPSALHNYQDFIGNFENKSDIEYISSRVLVQDISGNPIRVIGWPWHWPLMLRDMLVAHPGSLHSSSLFNRYGKFDSSFKIAGDYELLLRAKQDLKTAFMNEITVVMSEGGISDSIRAIQDQCLAAIKSGGANKLSAFINMIYIIFKFCIKKSLRHIGLNLYLKK